MKKTGTILIIIFFILAELLLYYLSAQTPQKFSYQALLRDNKYNLLTNTKVGIKISILEGSSQGTTLYSEIQTATTNNFGLLNIEIGANEGFNDIKWSNNNYYIKTETDPEGGINYNITGSSQLLSVPLSLQTKTFEGFESMTQSEIDTLTPDVGLIVYNKTTKNLLYNNGTVFRDILTQSISSGSIEIGQSYQGGTVFYIDETGKHGLIAALTDIPAIKWCVGNTYTSTGATGTAIGTGNSNTVAIIASQGEGNYAAKACADLVSGGYSDWYLPSADELKKLYINIAAFTGMNVNTRYWTSSETQGDPTFGKAIAIRWSDGVMTVGNNKDSVYPARAIRSF